MCIRKSASCLLKDEQREKIRNIAQNCNIDLKGHGTPQDPDGQLKLELGQSIEDIHLDFLQVICLNKDIIATSKRDITYNNQSHSLAKYVELLHLSQKTKSDLKITSTRYTDSCTINWGINTYTLWLQANSLLFHRNHHVYVANGVIQGHEGCIEHDGIEYPTPYSEQELNAILAYEKSEESKTRETAKKQLGVLLNKTREYFVTEGVFVSKNKEPSNNEYSFLVQTLVALEIISKEKYDDMQQKGERDKYLIRDLFRVR